MDFTEIAIRLSQMDTASINEEDTKAIIVEPVLQQLGWNVMSPLQVKRDYPRGLHGPMRRNALKSLGLSRAQTLGDYVLIDSSELKVIIEVKAPNPELVAGYGSALCSLHDYAAVRAGTWFASWLTWMWSKMTNVPSVRSLVFTNGREWLIWARNAGIEQTPRYANLVAPQAAALDGLRLLAKDSVLGEVVNSRQGLPPLVS